MFVCECVHVCLRVHVQEVEAKKSARVEALQRQTAARNRKEVEVWSQRMGERENEVKRRAHAERLKQLSVSNPLQKRKYDATSRPTRRKCPY